MTLIYSDVVAATLFWVTFVAWVAIDLQTALVGIMGRRIQAGLPGRSRSGRSIRVGLVAIWIGIGVGLAVAARTSLQLAGAPALLVVGLLLAWSGLALRLWAKRTLGRFFVAAVVIQPGHQVVTAGPYASIRHPGYAGMLLALLGLGMATANLVTTALFVGIPAVLLMSRITTEEGVLIGALGKPYIDYQKTTSRLIPRVW